MNIPALAPSSPVYPLNSSSEENPELFLISGLSGQVMPFKKCVRMIAGRYRVTGLLYPHLAGEQQRFTSIGQVAEYFHTHVASQERSVVLIFGFSKGGAIAFELARRLIDEGKQVGLILFDTNVRALRKKRNPPAFWIKDLVTRLGEKGRWLRAAMEGDHKTQAKLSSIAAIRRYSPSAAAVPTVLIRPKSLPKRPKYEPVEDLGWGRVTILLRVVHTDGDHMNAFKGENLEPFAHTLVEAADILMHHFTQSSTS